MSGRNWPIPGSSQRLMSVPLSNSGQELGATRSMVTGCCSSGCMVWPQLGRTPAKHCSRASWPLAGETWQKAPGRWQTVSPRPPGGVQPCELRERLETTCTEEDVYKGFPGSLCTQTSSCRYRTMEPSRKCQHFLKDGPWVYSRFSGSSCPRSVALLSSSRLILLCS